mmetsp:Transcript_12463/g.30689  ORF Transcript_12463/g.30689 Transcript_12463/m.30689 type:complete len:216 (+) Transcript_12463:1036-1683(+)
MDSFVFRVSSLTCESSQKKILKYGNLIDCLYCDYSVKTSKRLILYLNSVFRLDNFIQMSRKALKKNLFGRTLKSQKNYILIRISSNRRLRISYILTKYNIVIESSKNLNYSILKNESNDYGENPDFYHFSNNELFLLNKITHYFRNKRKSNNGEIKLIISQFTLEYLIFFSTYLRVKEEINFNSREKKVISCSKNSVTINYCCDYLLVLNLNRRI